MPGRFARRLAAGEPISDSKHVPGNRASEFQIVDTLGGRDQVPDTRLKSRAGLQRPVGRRDLIVACLLVPGHDSSTGVWLR